ncbi:hypothetical protein [Trichocoleus sp. DQ-A3]
MMQQPGLDPGNCPNYRTCGSVGSADEELEFIWGENHETIRLTRLEAAIRMLKSRGCSQNLDSLEINNLISEIQFSFEAVKERLGQFENAYIAPIGSEVHSYSVKRGKKVYLYNKLAAREKIFGAAERVKVIHLSNNDDPRNIEARLGVERRNQLTQARTKLKEIQLRLADALDLLE